MKLTNCIPVLVLAISFPSNSIGQFTAHERWTQSIQQLKQKGIDSIFVFEMSSSNHENDLAVLRPISDYIPVNNIPREVGDTIHYTEPDSIDMVYTLEGCSNAQYVFFKKNNQLFLLRFDDCYIYDTLELKEDKLVNNLFKYKQALQERFKHSRTGQEEVCPSHTASYTFKWFVNGKTYTKEIDSYGMWRETDARNKAILHYNANLLSTVLTKAIWTIFEKDKQQHLFRELKQLTTERRIKNPFKKQP